MTLLLTILTVLVLLLGLPALFTLWTARKVESVLPPSGRFVDVPGARLHVRDFPARQPGADPDAPAILMVHGLAGQLAHFTYGVTARLEGRYRLVVVDRPGSGYSPRDEGTPADLRTQADALAALIGSLGLQRPLVVGHSLGGALALTLALEHADKTGGLALIAPLTHMQERVPPVFEGLTILSPRVRRFVAWTFAIPASIRNSRKAMDQVFGPEAVPGDFATRGGGLLGLRPSAFLSASSDLQALPDWLPGQEMRYGELDLPVTILYGRHDRILDPQAHGQALVDKVPGARLQLVDGGHMLPITNPEVTAAFIEAAAAACRPAARAAATR